MSYCVGMETASPAGRTSSPPRRLALVPDLLTALRVVLAPVFVATLPERPGVALAVASLAAASDFADGRLARRFGGGSRRGAALDVVADAVFVLAGFAALAGVYALAGIALLPLLGMALAAAVAVGSVLPLGGRSLRRLPLAVWGMVIAHFGVAVALFGMAADTAFQQERLVAAQVGDTVEDGPWRITLVSVDPVAGPNWTALEATLATSYKGGPVTVVRPQARSFWTPPPSGRTCAFACCGGRGAIRVRAWSSGLPNGT